LKQSIKTGERGGKGRKKNLCKGEVVTSGIQPETLTKTTCILSVIEKERV